MRIAFDIDNTVITQGSPGNEYNDVSCKENMVDVVNKLYDDGHEIYFFTARHFKHFLKTEKMLKEYGFKYHGLVMNKISCNLFVDDRGFRWEDGREKELFDLVEELKNE
jgi:hypothetical protein